jgi:hypothetical protein
MIPPLSKALSTPGNLAESFIDCYASLRKIHRWDRFLFLLIDLTTVVPSSTPPTAHPSIQTPPYIPIIQSSEAKKKQQKAKWKLHITTSFSSASSIAPSGVYIVRGEDY